MRFLLLSGLIMVVASTAMAQDVLGPSNPAGNPAMSAVGDAAEIQARRLARERARRGTQPTREQIAACRKKGTFRSQYGAAHPKVRLLYRLCKNSGL
ncbi:hypothetical protein [Aureimonas psammosilenae]|jgi:hypothetical protein|uniref:hypothetical protein n=1 Tax=Aureimonas psammosilenae TaxID=2495496 RepID=UPI0012610971|nr:hypothetical protein [Aureimonas psammosilenae]